MRPPIKLSAIDQEHLQELYEATGVARDDLPYTEQFEAIVQGFQDRTFKNAHQEQVYAALLKYTRTGSIASTGNTPDPRVSDEQIKQLKGILARIGKGGKVLPYSDEYDATLKEFIKVTGVELSSTEFWQTLLRAQGGKRRPPPRRAKAAAPSDDADDSDGE